MPIIKLNNLSIVFVLLAENKDYYRVVSETQLGFDHHYYCFLLQKRNVNVVYTGRALSYTKLVHRHATQTEGNKYFKST